MIKITHDLFDIAWRLKAIDNRYELFYNNKLGRYEVWNQRGLQVVVPYPCLDERTVRHVQKTRIEKAEQLLLQIERDNEALLAKVEKAQKEACEYKSKNLIRYLEKGKGYLPNYDEI